MIKTSFITNLGNSINQFDFELSLKSFISKHEFFNGSKIDKSKINIISVFPISNAESTFYKVMWELNA
ncbi:MAG: hypothetical protein NVV82_25410 [Sporocytophaga sp.]|jgi:hypothetical protein|nr:hypothetical protein [Sporocytophaga sp.]